MLIVDDEPEISNIIRLGMRKFGYEVDLFNDPRMALSQFKPNYYDAIIVDVRMPDMTGFELARKIWAKEPNARICFCSAFEIYENEAQKVFVNLNTHCFIKKPVLPSDLAKHIEAHLVQAK